MSGEIQQLKQGAIGRSVTHAGHLYLISAKGPPCGAIGVGLLKRDCHQAGVRKEANSNRHIPIDMESGKSTVPTFNSDP